MNKLFSIVLILFLSTPAFADIASITSEIAHVRDITVTVMMGPKHGSGVVFKPKEKTYVLTAWHVLEGYESTQVHRVGSTVIRTKITQDIKVSHREVTEISSSTVRTYSAKIVSFSPAHDAAILEVIGDTHFKVGASIDFDYSPKIGEQVIHSGAMVDKELYNMLSLGHYTQVDLRNSLPLGPRKLDSVSTIWYGGSSGGGVFNSKGKFIGMAVQAVMGCPGISLMSPLRNLRDYLEGSVILETPSDEPDYDSLFEGHGEDENEGFEFDQDLFRRLFPGK